LTKCLRISSVATISCSILISEFQKDTIPLDSFHYFKTTAPTIIDEQLIRLTGKEGILTLPLVVQKQYIGLFVVGLNQTESSLLQKDLGVLSMFSGQAAVTLHMYYLRQRREKAMVSQRLKATSTLSRKIVHEVNTPLSIIKNVTKILETKLAEQHIHHDELRIINEEINRITTLLHGLSDFSVTKLQLMSPTDINETLSKVVKLFKESLMLDLGIQFHVDFDFSLPLINADEYRVKQVFINLIQNAIDALPEGGNIHISTKCITGTSDSTFSEDRDTTFEYAEIEIIDDGPGIPETMKARLFEPFTTSKSEHHKGLGLSIVYNIVTQLKGHVTFKSHAGSGTVFTIVLPIARNFSN